MSEKPEVDFYEGPPPADLEITDLIVGDGPEAVAGQNVSVHYVGVAHSTGEEFDASYNRGSAFQFPLGGGRVIAGWDRGVQGMRVGGRPLVARPTHPTRRLRAGHRSHGRVVARAPSCWLTMRCS